MSKARRHHRIDRAVPARPDGAHPGICESEKGITPIKYLHPLLEDICADTYGVMIYQEQVMAAASKLAGYSLAQADLLRRLMGKKEKGKMAKERRNFIEGCATDKQNP